jgi:hypothetical protein
MKLMTGWALSAGLVFAAAAANAQVMAPYEIGRSPYAVVSDIEGPYAAMPRDTLVARYGPTLLPPQEVYAVVRDGGFLPLGIPRQRGLVYTIAVIDRGGDDGRLMIDARTGRIIRFLPAYRTGNNFNEDVTVGYGPVGPPVGPGRAGLRPPGSIPHVASRTPPVPMPKASPPHAGEVKPLAAEPAQQSASVQAKPAEAPATPPAASAAEPKPSQILPTQAMPKAQGLD